MDKQQKSPIVAERDGLISSASDGLKKESYKAKKSIVEGQGLSSMWKAVALISLLGLLMVSWIGWQQYQAFAQLHERFEVLDSRLNNTDESVNQSGAAMQINIGKHSDQLKKHWSEIRKLWGVANDKNKGKIASNAKDIAFLAAKRKELNKALNSLKIQLDKDRATAEAVGENFFGLSADMDNLNDSLGEYFKALEKIELSIVQQNLKIQNNLEAMASVDAFRRQVNQKILKLEQAVAKQQKPEVNKPQTIGEPAPQ
jgi:chromosome segregation ATPase